MSTFQIGDRVRLLKLDEWFFNGIEPDAVSFLKSCVGQMTELVAFDEYGHVELEFVRSASDEDYCSHTVFVDQSWIEKV